MGSSQERLLSDVIEKYPMSLRARTQLQAYYDESGRQEEIPMLHQEIVGCAQQLEYFNTSATTQHYDVRESPTAIMRSSQWMIYAMATLKSSKDALEWADYAIPLLQRTYPMQFKGDLTLKNTGDLPIAWPVLTARNTVRDHAAEIDAARVAREAGK